MLWQLTVAVSNPSFRLQPETECVMPRQRMPSSLVPCGGWGGDWLRLQGASDALERTASNGIKWRKVGSGGQAFNERATHHQPSGKAVETQWKLSGNTDRADCDLSLNSLASSSVLPSIKPVKLSQLPPAAILGQPSGQPCQLLTALVNIFILRHSAPSQLTFCFNQFLKNLISFFVIGNTVVPVFSKPVLQTFSHYCCILAKMSIG